MGFSTQYLAPYDQNTLAKFEPVILKAFRTLAISISTGTYAIKQWFGEADELWVKELQTKLNRMADLLAIFPVEVRGTILSFTKIYHACSPPPADGWGDYTAKVNNGSFITPAQNQNFSIELGFLWDTAPTYRPEYYRMRTCPFSKFHTIVHELTHNFMNTQDHVNGYNESLKLSIKNKHKARNNADNWAYFIVDFASDSM